MKDLKASKLAIETELSEVKVKLEESITKNKERNKKIKALEKEIV